MKFPLEIMTCIIACACCWSVGNHNNFRERYSDIQIFLNGDSLLNGSRVDLHGWDFEMELWKDSCCSRREASAKLGDQERKLCVKTLFISENFHS